MAVDLQERQQRHVEAAALEIGELLRRRHDRLGVGGAAELEIEQRHAADRALFDHPGHGAVPAFFDQDARHVGGDAEADVDGVAVAQFLRDAAGDDLGDAERRRLERSTAGGRSRPKSRDRRACWWSASGRARRRSRRPECPARRRHAAASEPAAASRLTCAITRPPLLRTRERLIERAENAALVLIGEIAALVGGGGADDRDIGDDGRKEQPVFAGEVRRG